jgi:precorrin-2 dehydrogenase/sirohydrochlorin ferrochelatase
VSATGAFAFPIYLDVRDRAVFVAGGGREADAKARTLVELGARVTLWTVGGGDFHEALLDGVTLAIVGTRDHDVNHRIAAACRERGILVNTVDDIPWCDWSAPAILRRGDLTLAIGTAGVAPALAVRLRDRIAEDVIGPEYAELVELFAEARPRIMASGRSFAERRRLWYALVDGQAIHLLREGREAEARAAVDGAITAWEAVAA